METQTIKLSERESEFVRRSVLEGRYKDANEVVEAGLRLLEQREEEERLALERLRAEVKKGMDDLEAGRYVEINGPEEMSLVFDEVKRRVAARAVGAALDVQAPQV